MKKSNYNYIVTKENYLYCFNGISKSYFKLDKDRKSFLINILESPDKFEAILPSFYKKLCDGEFIVEDAIDEVNTIRHLNKMECNSKNFKLVILPTLDCNFHCWYCYEKHNSTVMSNDTIEKVKKYITHITEKKEIESLGIEWFGGEPFMYFYEVIKPLTFFAKNICKENNIPFYSSATTNGFLIDSNIAYELPELNLSYFQITLDGDKIHHDKTRIAKNCSSFETILKNINYICSSNKDARITIRINYDDKNFHPQIIFDQVKKLINKNYHNNITFLLRKVWQVEKVNKGKNKILEFISLIKESNFCYAHEGDFVTDFVPCYASKKNMKLITPMGSIGKCTTKEDFEEQSIGTLTKDGTLKWKDDISFDDVYCSPLFENENCIKCKQLPLCMGACPRFINTDGIVSDLPLCKGNPNDLDIKDIIANYCEITELLE